MASKDFGPVIHKMRPATPEEESRRRLTQSFERYLGPEGGQAAAQLVGMGANVLQNLTPAGALALLGSQGGSADPTRNEMVEQTYGPGALPPPVDLSGMLSELSNLAPETGEGSEITWMGKMMPPSRPGSNYWTLPFKAKDKLGRELGMNLRLSINEDKRTGMIAWLGGNPGHRNLPEAGLPVGASGLRELMKQVKRAIPELEELGALRMRTRARDVRGEDRDTGRFGGYTVYDLRGFNPETGQGKVGVNRRSLRPDRDF